MSRQPLLNSRTIGIAENALRAILRKTLSGTGLDYQRWVALKSLAGSPTPLSAEALAEQLQYFLKIETATAVNVARSLQERGLVKAGDGSLVLTQDGATLYKRLNEQTRQLSQQVYAGIDANDLAASHRVLQTLTDRANAILAS